MNTFVPPPPPAKHRAELSPRSGYLKAEGLCKAKTETPFLHSKSAKAATGFKPTPQQRKPFGRGSRFSRAAETLRTLTLSALLALPAATALAQVSPNQHEMMRQYGLDCSQRYDGCGGSSYQGRVIHLPDQEWINYHGAMAANNSGNTGVAEFARSKREAEREALRKCGAPDCKILAFARNGCLAAAFDGRRSAVGAADTKEGAEARAMRHCQADGSTCVVNYSKCFLPVRIR